MNNTTSILLDQMYLSLPHTKYKYKGSNEAKQEAKINPLKDSVGSILSSRNLQCLKSEAKCSLTLAISLGDLPIIAQCPSP
jgi:hypothetical protein